MRRILRLPLSPRASSYLDEWTAELVAAPDPRAESDRLWPQKGQTLTVQEIRERLAAMNGKVAGRCMYCECNEAGHIDHFDPRSRNPAATFVWSNHLLACDVCNSNHKRERFHSPSGETPIDPTADDPGAHLEFLPSGAVRARTPKGAWSVEVFGLDRELIARQRRDTWTALEAILTRYGRYRRGGDEARAARVRDMVQRCPCPTVVARFFELSRTPHAAPLFDPECLAVLREAPEVYDW